MAESPKEAAAESPKEAAEPAMYPPYAPYSMEPVPPSVVEVIDTGRKIRVQHKSKARQAAHSPPRFARPKGPKVTDVMLSPRTMRRHQRCLRQHNVAMTDRLQHLSRPSRRYVITKWRENANILPPQAINRFRNFLDAYEPFQPDQAYEFFVNLRKGRGKGKKPEVQKEMRLLCGNKHFVWARKATVAFARGIQRRLSKPGSYQLVDKSLRLSNLILNELCCVMHMHVPSRQTRNLKSKFVVEMADKVAVWIEEILGEAKDRMLMMDFDEDDEVLEAMSTGSSSSQRSLTPKQSKASTKSTQPSEVSTKPSKTSKASKPESTKSEPGAPSTGQSSGASIPK